MNNQKTDANGHKRHGYSARLILLAMSAIGLLLLVVLMMMSGEKTANAYTQTQVMALQNAKVEVVKVNIQHGFVKQQKVYGLIESAKNIEIGFELAGSITDVYVVEGQSVKKGDILAALDLDRLNAQVKQLRATLNRAKADAEIASLSAKRVEELVNAKLESAQNLDQANARLKAANAAVKEVEASLDALSVELAKSQMRAPFNGQITDQLVDLGSVVNTGQGIFRIIETSKLEARFGLPTDFAFGLNVGERFTLDADGKLLAATLKSTSAQRTQATRTINTIFTLENNTPDVLVGDLVTISVERPVDMKGAWVPMSAISNGVRGLWRLFVAVKDDSSHYIVESRTIAVEHIEDERAFVSGALAPDDLLIVSGLQRLVPGQRLNKVELRSRTGSTQ